MREHESPNTTLPEEPSSSRWLSRRRVAVASVVVLLLVVGIFGPSWYHDRVAENVPVPPQAEPVAEPVAPGARPLDATQLMREARSKTWATEADLTGQIRQGSHKIPVVLYRRDQNIQFQFLESETRQWRVFHLRQGPADSGPPDLFEMKDGKTFRFPDHKLGESIAGTDITYEDLAMPFLSWPGGAWKDAENVKGQDCWVIRAQNPGTAGNYALVYLWIHQKTHGLMQMVGYDQQGKALKRMQVTDVMEVGAWGVVNSLAGRPLDRYAIRTARFDSYDPVTDKTVSITYLEFDKPKKTPPPEDGAGQ